MRYYPYSPSDPPLPSSFFDWFKYFSKGLYRYLCHNIDDGLVLDIENIDRKFAISYDETIDNLSLRVFQPKGCFELYILKEGGRGILGNLQHKIKRAILISNVNYPPILCLNTPSNSVYFFKDCGKWREVDRSEYIHLLNKARSVRPIKEISIDTSNKNSGEGLIIDTDRFCFTYQVTYKPNLGYVARSVRYGDDVIWKARDDTQRCIKATLFLKKDKPVGIITLIYVDDLQIARYRFQNNKWRYIDEEDYMKMVRSNKPLWPNFQIEDYQHHYWLMVYMCPGNFLRIPDVNKIRRQWLVPQPIMTASMAS